MTFAISRCVLAACSASDEILEGRDIGISMYDGGSFDEDYKAHIASCHYLPLLFALHANGRIWFLNNGFVMLSHMHRVDRMMAQQKVVY